MANDLTTIARQVGATVLPENAQWINRLQIRSESSSRLYIVAQRRSDGSWGCSCMGWKAHRTCKHLDAMRPVLVSVSKRGSVNAAR